MATPEHAAHLFYLDSQAPDAVARDQTQLGAVLEEDVTCTYHNSFFFLS